ncbi:MAG: hypothetical protein E7399_04945 [Ruminococcaceae bacterium]|nr:hypothetical protein [Oscillospiraceae bacterium]
MECVNRKNLSKVLSFALLVCMLMTCITAVTFAEITDGTYYDIAIDGDLKVGESKDVVVTVTTVTGGEAQVVKSDRALTVSSSDPSVVEVVSGKLVGKKEGVATITVYGFNPNWNGEERTMMVVVSKGAIQTKNFDTETEKGYKETIGEFTNIPYSYLEYPRHGLTGLGLSLDPLKSAIHRYEYSKDHGDVISVEESITSFMFKIWECGSHNSTLGGCHPENGKDASNELSYLFLQVLRNIHDSHPRMVVRIAEDTPVELTDLIIKIWSEGMCDPTVVSDTTVIPGLLKLGVTLKDARNYATLGCQEIEIPGKCNTGCEDGSFNLAKVLEIAMLGGKSPIDPSYQLGPVTKTFEECETFDDLFDGYIRQLKYFTEIHLYLCRKSQECKVANHSKLLKGLFTDGCLEKGIPHDAGGPIYGYGVIETAGLAATADSMIAIKKFIYDEKTLTKKQLITMLKANFDGFERERQMLLNGAPKFGNDNAEVDELATRILDLYWTEISKYETGRGGVYTGACSLLTGGISFGATMGAMADGRFAHEPLGNTMGPRPGADTHGLTAMLNSVAKLPMKKGVGGTTLNVILTTKMLATTELRRSVSNVIRSFLKNGGCMAQITTANKEDLIDAKCHPERHSDLTVRVGGYSIQFVQMDAISQDEIISRYV